VERCSRTDTPVTGMQVHIFIFVMALCHIVVSYAANTTACSAVSSLDL